MTEREATPITDDEYEAWARTFYRAFGEDGHPDDIAAYRRLTRLDRTLAVRDRGGIVATAAVDPFTASVAGTTMLPCAGVTAVAVLPTHRRRGLLTAMMRRLLDQAHERGEPLAALYASESPIYERYGFGPAIGMVNLAVERPWARLTSPPELVRDVVFRDAAEALDEFPAVYDRARGQRGGMLSRSSERWWIWLGHDEERHRDGFSPRYHATVPERGYVVYRVKPAWKDNAPDGTLRVEELVACDPEAEAALWQFCFGVDLMARLEASLRPADDPLPLMVENRARLRVTAADPLYLRFVDLAEALTLRPYSAEGDLVIRVDDPFCPWNTGCWRLEGGPDGGRCTRTDRPADLALGSTELAAAYLGGLGLGHLARARRVEEHRPGAVAIADRMLAAEPLPWNPFMF